MCFRTQGFMVGPLWMTSHSQQVWGVTAVKCFSFHSALRWLRRGDRHGSCWLRLAFAAKRIRKVHFWNLVDKGTAAT